MTASDAVAIAASVNDDLDPLRRLRPDEILPDDPPDLDVLSSGRRRLLSDITGSPPSASVPTPSIYPRLAYRDEHAALDFLFERSGSSNDAKPAWSTRAACSPGSSSATA